MKSKHRKITVNNRVYLWHFTANHRLVDEMWISRLYFSPEDDKGKNVTCMFQSPVIYPSGCAFNEGVLAIKNGQEYLLNLNQPKFVAEIIEFLLANWVDFDKHKQYLFRKANNEILQQMGYESKIFNMIGTKLGYFWLNEKCQTFEGNIDWLGNNIPIFLRVGNVYDEAYFSFALGTLARLLVQPKEKDFEFRKFVSEKLTPLANDWRDMTVEQEEIAEEVFANRISISSIKLDDSGRFAIYFHDGGMFSGYQIMGYGHIAHGIQVVNMELNNWKEPLEPTYWGDL